ncbi:uncharacterized protein EURHEDRAFT_411852 [Aspergillus ruber CBS 135680]|uniref:Uncharacterized protein n=1 Tax=Aspergillus ruber (strain CBS 135680) TaxID=1388766 RepID=A0A017SF71_ASPRC|nr:uncharacterized protein EURHEDRAFT_411852 [Aspergillus ruber CBS 135680]EYE95572.1 hypothetical protein EURHEDRAFT_411852 [Aspergillus ruber CBS 135680]
MSSSLFFPRFDILVDGYNSLDRKIDSVLSAIPCPFQLQALIFGCPIHNFKNQTIWHLHLLSRSVSARYMHRMLG